MKQFIKTFWGTCMVILFMSFTQTNAQEVLGTWKGKLAVQGTEVPLVFNIENKDGTLSSTMDSPSQGATGIPMDTTVFENNQLTLIFKQGGVKYVASVENDKLKGTFYQGGMELPLEMEKSEKTIPGNPALVSSDKTLEEIASLDQGDYKYSVEDYFARPKARSFQFSPNGKYLSYREKIRLLE